MPSNTQRYQVDMTHSPYKVDSLIGLATGHWHCQHSNVQQGRRNCLASVCLSHPAAERHCGGFAAVGLAGRRY